MDEGDVTLYNVAIDSTELKSSGAIISLLVQGGRLNINASMTTTPNGLYFIPQSTQSSLIQCSNSYIAMTADITVEGAVSVSSATVDIQELAIFSITQSTGMPSPGRYPLFTGTVTGRRYLCRGNAVINTRGAGPDVIPGYIEGKLSNGGQYI